MARLTSDQKVGIRIPLGLRFEIRDKYVNGKIKQSA